MAVALRGRQFVEADVRQHVQRHRDDACARPQHIAVARAHLDAIADRPNGLDRRRKPACELDLRRHRVDQAAGVRAERVAAAGILGQVETPAGERVQEQHVGRPRVVDVAARNAFELGREHVVLLCIEAELVHALLDRLAVVGRERVQREVRIVRARQRRLCPSTKRFQARVAIAWRCAAVPVRRSPPTVHDISSARSLSPIPWPARVSSAQACGWCQCTHPPPSSIWSPPHSRCQVRPPRRSRASISVQSSPAIVSSRAAVTPAKPPPITIASSTR